MTTLRDLESNGQVVLKRFDGAFDLPPKTDTGGPSLRGVVLDTETTGLSAEDDQIIEIALRPFTFDPRDLRLRSVEAPYEALQQPDRPLSREIQLLTGISDADLAGRSIDWSVVRTMLDDAVLILAHNAGFDRRFMDPAIGANQHRWGCTQTQIDWLARGHTSTKLELLSHDHGFYVSAHRARADVDAVLSLLCRGESHSPPYLKEVLRNVRRPRIRLWARGAAYATRGLLKRRGYRWHAPDHTWYREVPRPTAAEERTWLTETIYRGRDDSVEEAIRSTDRFREPTTAPWTQGPDRGGADRRR